MAACLGPDDACGACAHRRRPARTAQERTDGGHVV